MNVLYICSSLERTGPSNQLLNIANNIKSDFDVTILTLKPEKSNSMRNDFSDFNIVFGYELSFFYMLRFIRGFDIVHSQGIKADTLSALFSRKGISTLRNYPYEDYPALYGKLLGSCMAFFHFQILKMVKKRVTISASTREKNQNKSGLKFELIYNGVDTERFHKKNSVKNKNLIECKEKYKKTFIYTGPLIERKNVTKLVSVMNNYPDYLLVILGGGPCLDDLKSHAKSNILFLGNVDNVVDYLSLADVFIMFSKSEGFPNAVLEALSTGLPCILSNIPSHADVKEIMGDCITLIEEDDNN
ncbi:hypothetical protein OJ16_02615, partial [Vibrio renipiscarius]